jgi:hypothetical protein
MAIVFESKRKKRACVTAVGSDSSFQKRNCFARIAAHRRNGRSTLIQILGRLLNGT